MKWIRQAPLTIAFALLPACSQNEPPADHIGYVEADWVYLAPPESGRLVERAVREGDRVSAGDVLFRLDAVAQEAAKAEADGRLQQARALAENISSGARQPEIRALQAALDEAQARFDETEAEHKRATALVSTGAVSQSRADRAESAWRSAQASVKAAEERIAVAKMAGRPAERVAADAAVASAAAALSAAAYRLEQRWVVAPSAGRIEETFHDPGEIVSSGSPVLALLPDNGLKAFFFVHETELPSLELGQSVSVGADGLAAPVKATISFIASNAEFTPPIIYSKDARGKLVFRIEAQLPPDAGLHAGLPVDVSW